MQPTCSNCGETHDEADVFCENCGLDFLTGSLPDPGESVSLLTPSGAGPPVAGGAEEVLTIAADRSFHRRMDTDGVLAFPDPEPDQRTMPIDGETVLIGRQRPSRGIFTDIDLSTDPAVSSRHAMLNRRPDGSWTITDLGSTNGTFVGDATVPITPHTPVSLAPGTPVYVGAWTRLDLGTAPGVA